MCGKETVIERSRGIYIYIELISQRATGKRAMMLNGETDGELTILCCTYIDRYLESEHHLSSEYLDLIQICSLNSFENPRN